MLIGGSPASARAGWRTRWRRTPATAVSSSCGAGLGGRGRAAVLAMGPGAALLPAPDRCRPRAPPAGAGAVRHRADAARGAELFPDLGAPAVDSDAARFQLFDSTATFLRAAAAPAAARRARRPPGRRSVVAASPALHGRPDRRHARARARDVPRRRADARSPADRPRSPSSRASRATRTIASARPRPDALRALIGATAGAAPDEQLSWRSRAARRATRCTRARRSACCRPRAAWRSSARAVAHRRRAAGRARRDRPPARAAGAGDAGDAGGRRRRRARVRRRAARRDRRADDARSGGRARRGGARGPACRGRRCRRAGTASRTTSCGRRCTTSWRPRRRRAAPPARGGGAGDAPCADPGSHLAELAYHFFEASATVADRAHAVEYARRAGAEASRSLAFEEAARLYGSALAALERSGTATRGCELELLLALGDALNRGGDVPAGRERPARGVASREGLGAPRVSSRWRRSASAAGWRGRGPAARRGCPAAPGRARPPGRRR